MRNGDFTVNDAIRIQLALNAYCFIRTQDYVCRKLQALLGDVHDLTEDGRVIFRQQTAP